MQIRGKRGGTGPCTNRKGHYDALRTKATKYTIKGLTFVYKRAE